MRQFIQYTGDGVEILNLNVLQSMAKELLFLLSTNRQIHRVRIYVFDCFIFCESFPNFWKFGSDFSRFVFCLLHYNLCILLLCFLARCKQRSTPPSALRTRLQVQMSMERPDCDFIIQQFTITITCCADAWIFESTSFCYVIDYID